MRAIYQLLKRLTPESLSRRSDEVEVSGTNPGYVAQLRAEGFIHPSENRLTREASLLYFEQFPLVSCPPGVQRIVQEYGIEGLMWRSAGGVILHGLTQGRGAAYEDLKHNLHRAKCRCYAVLS
jgi:hypothetical protein